MPPQIQRDAAERSSVASAPPPLALMVCVTRLVNLTFHGVGPRKRALDPGEARTWVALDTFRAVLDSVAGRRDVRVTFDDGNDSDLAYALPELRRRGLTATFFVVAGRLRTPGFLDEAAVRELASAGMTIGVHGMRHRPWRHLDDGELGEELDESRRVLEEVVGGPITQAACPFGSYDRRVLRALRGYGYERVYTSDRGVERPDAWLQARNTVHDGDEPTLVECVRRASRGPRHALRQRPKRLVKRWR
jgi:peptidoglycan/xylan/chitin deacetylase (PgdA/CDA1 family)